MSLPVHNSIADMDDQRGLAFMADMDFARSTSEICPPCGIIESIASRISRIDFSATGLPFLFAALLMSSATPMSLRSSLFAKLMKALALSARQTQGWVAFAGRAWANRQRRPASRSVAVSLSMNFAQVYDVAVSRRVNIFCFSLLMTSVAKCWPNLDGGATDDMGCTVCFLSRVAAHL